MSAHALPGEMRLGATFSAVLHALVLAAILFQLGVGRRIPEPEEVPVVIEFVNIGPVAQAPRADRPAPENPEPPAPEAPSLPRPTPPEQAAASPPPPPPPPPPPQASPQPPLPQPPTPQVAAAPPAPSTPPPAQATPAAPTAPPLPLPPPLPQAAQAPDQPAAAPRTPTPPAQAAAPRLPTPPAPSAQARAPQSPTLPAPPQQRPTPSTPEAPRVQTARPQPQGDPNSLRNTLERLRAAQSQQRPQQRAAASPARPRAGSPNAQESETLTASEKSAIASQIERCWTFDPGARNARELVTVIRVTVDRQGVVRNAQIMDTTRLGDPTFRAFAERARNSILDPLCSPLRLPADRYEAWRVMDLRFNPQGLL